MGGWQLPYTLDRKRFASLILSDFQVALKMYHYPRMCGLSFRTLFTLVLTACLSYGTVLGSRTDRAPRLRDYDLFEPRLRVRSSSSSSSKVVGTHPRGCGVYSSSSL